MKAVKLIEITLIRGRYEKGYRSLQKAVTEFMKTRNALHNYQARHQKDEMGNFPTCIDETIEHLGGCDADFVPPQTC